MKALMCLIGTLGLAGLSTLAFAQTSESKTGYRLDPSWPQMPAGLYFGWKDTPPLPKEREAQAAARRAAAKAPPKTVAESIMAEQRQPGIGGLAIDAQDHIYVFNRGVKPVMVFDRDGKLVKAGADQVINGKALNPNYIHSGAVDAQGNVYVIEREAHRIVKLSPGLDKFLLQLGVTGESGDDATHLFMPSGMAVLKSGNIVVTDGYGNNRVVLYDRNGRFIKQIGKGAGGPNDAGKGNGEWSLPHKLAVDKNENLYVCEETNGRIQVLDKDLNFIRILPNEGWNPWDFAIPFKDTGVGFVADHIQDRVVKLQLSDGKILDTWGKVGRGPGEFDWIHAVVVDSKGAVYAGDTYGQRVQKFVPGRT